jgi:hypothetical protein
MIKLYDILDIIDSVNSNIRDTAVKTLANDTILKTKIDNMLAKKESPYNVAVEYIPSVNSMSEMELADLEDKLS